MANPNKQETEKIRKDFHLHDRIFEKYYKERRSIRYFFKPLSFTIVDYYVKKSKIMVEDVLFIVGENYLITISKEVLPHYNEAFELTKTKFASIKNIGYLLYEILDYDIEETYNVLNVAEKKVSDMEKAILTPEDVQRKITNIITFKRDLLTMWRRFWSSSKILFSIKKGLTPIQVDDNLIRLFDDLHDTYVHQMEIVSIQREVLTDALTIYESVLANRLATISNKINLSLKRLTWVMFVLTGIATVLTVPNTIATFFGIPELPLTGSDYQFIINILVVSMIIPSVLFYWYWKKVKREAEKNHIR